MSSILNFGNLLPRGEIPSQVTPAIDALPSAETARDRRNRLARERRARQRRQITPEQRATQLETFVSKTFVYFVSSDFVRRKKVLLRTSLLALVK